MSADLCNCKPSERDPVSKDVSPDDYKGKSVKTTCRECGGLVWN